MSLAATLPAHLRPRREKVFGDGRPRPLDRNAKVRLITYARQEATPVGRCDRPGPRRRSLAR